MNFSGYQEKKSRMSICAMSNKDRTFTIRINDGDDVQIGVIHNVDNVPRGLDVATGFINGYLAGQQNGKDFILDCMREAMKIDPSLMESIHFDTNVFSEIDFKATALHEIE